MRYFASDSLVGIHIHKKRSNLAEEGMKRRFRSEKRGFEIGIILVYYTTL